MWSKFVGLWSDSLAFRIAAAIVIVGLLKMFT
jgi:hypothetical protein